MCSLPAIVFRLVFFSQFFKKSGQFLSVRAIDLILSAKIQVITKPLAIIDMALGRDRFPDQGLVKQDVPGPVRYKDTAYQAVGLVNLPGSPGVGIQEKDALFIRRGHPNAVR